jgi:TMEM175 potassium channel family protein
MPTSRIEAFSDGVFAIIITLLVLEIHVPQVQGQDISAALEHSLLAMAPKFLSYILSFVIVCIRWVAHHHLFHVLKRSDRGLSHPCEPNDRRTEAHRPASVWLQD